MGLFGMFGGSKKKEKSETTKHETQSQVSNGTSATTTGEQQTQTTSTLDAGVRDALSSFITDSLGGPSPDQLALRNLGDTLTANANNAAGALTGAVTDILNEARRSGEREVQRLQTDVAQASGGSTDNTFVMQATAEAQAGLESQLASVGGNLALQIHQMQGQDFQNAVAALTASAGAGQQNAQSLAYLVDALKGGTTTSTAESTGTSNTVTHEDIQSVIDALIKLKGSIKASEFKFGIS